MEKSSSVLRALVCAALLAVIFISLFLPVVTFNSAEKFDDEEKIGYYHVDVEHAGTVKVSLASAIFSSGKSVNTLVKLYKLDAKIVETTALKTAKEADKEKALKADKEKVQKEIDLIQADIDELNAERESVIEGISEKEDAKIQKKLNQKSFLKKVALRISMYNEKKDSSYLTFALVLTVISILLLALDITFKAIALVKAKLEMDSNVVKALKDFRLPIAAFILHMFTVQHFVAKTRGIVSLGSGIVVGLIAMLAFAVVRGIEPVLEAKNEGGDKYKKTLIKQGITVAVLLVTVIIALLGMKMSVAMISNMNDHYSDFLIRYRTLANKLSVTEVNNKVSESMSIVVFVVSIFPIIIYSALGYMLARVGAVEKTRTKKSRKPKTPLGSFYVGYIFVAVAYILTLILFTVDDSAKRHEMYSNCQMSVVFSEYKEEGSLDNTNYNLLSTYKDTLNELSDAYKEEYKNANDKATKEEIKSDLADVKLELDATNNKMNRMESCKKSTIIFIITMATLAVAAEIVFKNIKFDAEKIAESGKEN